jgi:hypothetical protein
MMAGLFVVFVYTVATLCRRPDKYASEDGKAGAWKEIAWPSGIFASGRGPSPPWPLSGLGAHRTGPVIVRQ